MIRTLILRILFFAFVTSFWLPSTFGRPTPTSVNDIIASLQSSIGGSGAGLLFPSPTPPVGIDQSNGNDDDDDGGGVDGRMISMMQRIASARNDMTLVRQQVADGDAALLGMLHMLQSLNVRSTNNTNGTNDGNNIMERARAAAAAAALATNSHRKELQSKLDQRATLELLLEATLFDLQAFIINIVGYALVGAGGITQSASYAVGSRAAVIRVMLARDAIRQSDEELDSLTTSTPTSPNSDSTAAAAPPAAAAAPVTPASMDIPSMSTPLLDIVTREPAVWWQSSISTNVNNDMNNNSNNNNNSGERRVVGDERLSFGGNQLRRVTTMWNGRHITDVIPYTRIVINNNDNNSFDVYLSSAGVDPKNSNVNNATGAMMRTYVFNADGSMLYDITYNRSYTRMIHTPFPIP